MRDFAIRIQCDRRCLSTSARVGQNESRARRKRWLKAIATAMAFGFAFVHPFEDGNGRIHRFLIHHQLAHSGFAPRKLIFRFSAVMLRERVDYDRVLESYSKTILPFIDYAGHSAQHDRRERNFELISVLGCDEIRGIFVWCVAETVRRNLLEEFGFLARFDQALAEVMNLVDIAGPTGFPTDSIDPLDPPESGHAL